MAEIVPVAQLNPEAVAIVEDMRFKISTGDGFGITVQGTHVTLRWNRDGLLRSVTMVIDSVDDGKDDPQFEDK